jgi:hypothetical protein
MRVAEKEFEARDSREASKVGVESDDVRQLGRGIPI